MLDVGSGTGILCAAFYEMVKTGKAEPLVVGIEHIEHLAQSSYDNLMKSFSEPLHAGCIKIVCGDGR